MHYIMHSGEKPFACQICDRKCVVKFSLVRDKATHSDVRSLKCSICPEGTFFKTKEQLKDHMIFHYEPKFSCSHCDHKSYRTGDLKMHEKTHLKK